MSLEEKTLQEKIIAFIQAGKLQNEALAAIIVEIVKRQDNLESLLAKKLGIKKDETKESIENLKKNIREFLKE